MSEQIARKKLRERHEIIVIMSFNGKNNKDMTNLPSVG